MTKTTETIYITRPRCPRCNGTKVKTTHTAGDQGDGSVLRYAKCRDCKATFKIVLE